LLAPATANTKRKILMNLQGRNLSARMSGADVALLHSELRQLGYAIAEAEISAQGYGATTQQAVRNIIARPRASAVRRERFSVFSEHKRLYRTGNG
jgi:hypothetical protein